MPRGKRRKNKGRERSADSLQQTRDVVPVQAEIDTTTYLVNMDQNCLKDIQLRVMALMEKALFFRFWGRPDLSFEESKAALNLSKEKGFQGGICGATLLMLSTLEEKGDIEAAFLLAVSLKATHFEEVKAHVRRLREMLKRSLGQSFKLAQDLKNDLMSSGIDFFEKGSFGEAVEYFIEVVRLFCVFNREVHFYLARCQFKLGENFKAKENCQKVLQHHPDDHEARNLMDSIDAIIPTQNKDQKSTKKRKSTPVSDATPPVTVVPDKKSVMNRKQKMCEEHRRIKEIEEIGIEIKQKIEIEKESEEQKEDGKKNSFDGEKSLPSYDVKSAMEATSFKRMSSDKQPHLQAAIASGARPKQRKSSEVSGKTKVTNAEGEEGRKKRQKAIDKHQESSEGRKTSSAAEAIRNCKHRNLGIYQGQKKKEEWQVNESQGKATKARQTFRKDCSNQGFATAATICTLPTRANSETSVEMKPSKSQWERLEEISSLQIHRTLNFGKASQKEYLTATAVNREKGAQTIASDTLCKNGSVQQSTKILPEGVFTICAHFLQDNRRGQAFQHPRPCLRCSKDSSKHLYGVWRSSKKEWQVMRPYPKEVSAKTLFRPCWYFIEGLKCRNDPCTFAHGQKELKFWIMERKSDQLSFRKTSVDQKIQSKDYRANLANPQERLEESSIIPGNLRPPPTGVFYGEFQLCKWWKSGQRCRYGRFCTYAHGEEELKSWMEHKNEEKENASDEEQTLGKTEREEAISRSEMVYSLPGVTVSWNKSPVVKIILRDDDHSDNCRYEWVFTVTFEISQVGKLRQIDLLHRYHDCYRLTDVKGFVNNKLIFQELSKQPWSYTLPWHSDERKGRMEVAITVSFNTTKFNQTSTQCLRFDFGKKPYLLQGLNVDIANMDALKGVSEIRQQLQLDPIVWTEGSIDIVPWPEITDTSHHDVLLLEKYRLPERIENVISLQIVKRDLSMENYKRVMHQLLFTEELFMKKAISRYCFNDVLLQCKSNVSDGRFGFAYAPKGELFGILSFQECGLHRLEGAARRLLTRNVKYSWLKPTGGGSKKVYQVKVENVEFQLGCITLRLSPTFCSELFVKNDACVSVDAQLQLNRQPLCEWHDTIDKLGPVHLNLLFPGKNTAQVSREDICPKNWLSLDSKINDSQKEVINRILSPQNSSSPLVVFGPFGTGKTFTLNQAIRQLVTRKSNHILLCTHTNSAADIHVEMLHDYLTKQKGLKASRPLRIYHTERRLNADSGIAKNYGLIENGAYVLPTREQVMRHRVVITTLAVSRNLLDLHLNHGFFTHILIDEAAQAMEPVALIPLALAGPNTKVVFTGDHMQMSPEVYSPYAREWGLQKSLPERLFDLLYCEEPERNSEIMFLTENYRCHPEILQFSSYNFYGEGLKASSVQPSHPRLQPLLFYSVNGMEEARENSYINKTEVEEVVKKVKELANDWPVEWKVKDLSRIGVISAYTSQVRAIRTFLRKESKELANITVESIYNVQGKEFRAVFISTVRTSLAFPKFDTPEDNAQQLYWEFFSDPKLLNTAVTRAMSLVAIVGDAISLCSVGECRGNWRDYIRRCDQLGSLFGTTYREIRKAVDAPFPNISLNPEAADFVPSTNKEHKSAPAESEKCPEELQDKIAIENSLENAMTVSGIERCHTRKVLMLGEVTSDEEERQQITNPSFKEGVQGDSFPKQDELLFNPEVKRTSELKSDEGSTGRSTLDILENAMIVSGTERCNTRKVFTLEEVTSDEGEETHQITNPSFEDGVQGDPFPRQDELMLNPEVKRTSELESDEGNIDQSTLAVFEEFRRESFEDETVFSRYFDRIIQALVQKCKETEEREFKKSLQNEEFPTLQDAATLRPKRSQVRYHPGKRSSQVNSSFANLSSEDYQIYIDAKGRQKARLVNTGFRQKESERLKRLIKPIKQDDFLDTEVLLNLVGGQPLAYLATTLRLDSKAVHNAYAVVSDTKTPDIKIKGRVKRVFDMDYVVVRVEDNQSDDELPCRRGKIEGVLHHIISPHERQFVCKVDYENPDLMHPINKSIPKIVILSTEGVRGVPLYKEMREGNEKKVKVYEIDPKEFLSGKYLFLVQYLQWRQDCTSPLGILIRKLPQQHTVEASMEISFAEHGIRKSFDGTCKGEVQRRFPCSWSIPDQERKRRSNKVIDGAFTIDPENSKDLDDALSLDSSSDSLYRVGIHIADVSYFVEAGSHLDKEAFFRCVSYYPGHDYQSVPMLPRELSENHCSLLPGKDRLCLSVFVDMSGDGEVVGEPHIERTVVRSSCQLTYSDAQKIIDGQQSDLPKIPEKVGSDIRTLNVLAQNRRKLRLREASFDHWSNSDETEDFEAHELVEEMMILVNEKIGEFLSSRDPQLAPLRIQLPPKDHKLKEWVMQNGQFIKYSLFLRGIYTDQALEHMTKDVQTRDVTEFKMTQSVWSDLCSAAESGDGAQLKKLICNERNYTQLAVVKSQFQRIKQKAQYVCERDQPEENIIHFSLSKQRYTHFTSPIRRYIDIQVHRLVLNLIPGEHGAERPSQDHIAKVCRRSSFAQVNSRKFDSACRKVHLAAKLKETSQEVTAIIALIEDKRMRFEITDQEYKHLPKKETEVKLSSLNPFEFSIEQGGSEIVLTWKLRLYIAQRESENGNIENLDDERKKVLRLLSSGNSGTRGVLHLPVKNWQKLLEAARGDDDITAKMLIEEIKAKHQRALRNQHNLPKTEKFDPKMEHFYEKQVSLRKFDVVQVQLSTHMTNGMLHPHMQLFKINPDVHICIEHRTYPRMCFASTKRYRGSQRRYSSLDEYIAAWEPVLAMEAATVAVDEANEFTIHGLDVLWREEVSETPQGTFSLRNDFCATRQIEFHPGDFVCIRVCEDTYIKKTHSFSNDSNKYQINSAFEEQPGWTTANTTPSLRGNSRVALSSIWVGHCVIRHVAMSNGPTGTVEMDLHQSASDFPKELLDSNHPSTITVIHRSLPHRRMFEALKELRNASHLAHDICMGKERIKGRFESPLPPDFSIVTEHPNCGFHPLNEYQKAAVKEALVEPFTLIQGPPGTGKTVTGVHIAFWFAKKNKQGCLGSHDAIDLDTPDKPRAPPQVIYCGPSNRSVDVVAEYMVRIPGLKIIRVYGDLREQAEFPIPNRRQYLKQSSDDGTEIPERLKKVSLHHIIRKHPCPYADDLRMYERKFEDDRKEKQRTSDQEVETYCKLIGKAETWALQSSGAQIILCTCSVAGSHRIITACDNVQQCIIDECGMCMELESLVPITFSRAKQVVLIGDHKQLQPVVKDQQAMTLGLNISMFERLSDRAQMLKLQYRMQKEICRFPSEYFYEGELKTDQSVPIKDPILPRSFWPHPNFPLAFCHVEGDEESTAIKTTHSSEQSKSNQKEVRKVVHVARSLIFKNNVSPSDVVILSPYREQRERISKALEGNIKSKEILVTTIIKSQGSEWDYVILSLVRSLNKDDFEPEPSMYWLREHLGFLTDEHLMNVGLTRARKGLCIIGNKNLLVLHPMWQELLEFYEQRKCVVNESGWPVSLKSEP